MFDKIKDIVSDVTSGKDLGDLDLGGYEKHLDGVTWPVSKDELIGALRANGAGDDVVERVRGASGDTFNGPDDLARGMAGSRADVEDTAQDLGGDLRKRL